MVNGRPRPEGLVYGGRGEPIRRYLEWNPDVERLSSAVKLASVFMRLCVLVAVPYAASSMFARACYRR